MPLFQDFLSRPEHLSSDLEACSEAWLVFVPYIGSLGACFSWLYLPLSGWTVNELHLLDCRLGLRSKGLFKHFAVEALLLCGSIAQRVSEGKSGWDLANAHVSDSLVYVLCHVVGEGKSFNCHRRLSVASSVALARSEDLGRPADHGEGDGRATVIIGRAERSFSFFEVSQRRAFHFPHRH